MKRPTMLLNRVLLNEALQVSVAVKRDIEVIRSRFEHEGMSFLTIALPTLCDALDQGLARGRLSSDDYVGFQPMSRSGSLPALLSGFFRRVFEIDGSLKDDPCIDSIRAIRQVTRLFKKVELPCSAARIKSAYERYKSNDESIDSTAEYPALLGRIAQHLWSDLQKLSDELYCSPGVFGTGATAERKSNNERHSITQWPSRSEQSFPIAYHGSHREDDTTSFEGVDFLLEKDELPVRVVQVPKTLKAPRTISVEPSHMMLMQQSIAKPLMAFLESDRFRYKSIRFTDQTVNNRLARESSIDGSLATIDLKDASDLVSLDLVKEVFSSCPAFLQLILDCRSTRAVMPDKSIVTLRKFASMGSAMCFPVEAMVFFTVVMASLVRQSGKAPSTRLLTALSAKVAVYGDDIIIPTETAPGVMEDLEAVGLKVNRSKSFYTGFFRESCGGDYFRGHDVTPSYVRSWDFTGSTRSSTILSAYVSLSNQFYTKGLWNASQYIREHICRLYGHIPRSTVPIGGVHFVSCHYSTGLRWNAPLYGWRVKGPVIVAGTRGDPILDIRAGMLACFGSKHLSETLVRKRGPLYEKETVHESVLGVSSECCVDRGYVRSPTTRWKCDIIHTTASQGIDHSFLDPYWVAGRLNPASLPKAPNPRISGFDPLTSIEPYASNTKRRWYPTKVGMSSW